MGLLDRIREGGYRDDGQAVVAPGAVPTAAATAARIAAGEDRLRAVRDLLDALGRRDDAELIALTRERPPSVDPRTDALLAGVVEHLLARRGHVAPPWCSEPGRFLARFWFISDVPGFRAAAIAQSPIALKRRGIMWPARSLERV